MMRVAWPRLATSVGLGLHPSSVRRLLWALPVVFVICVFYVFLGSTGTFSDSPSQLDYYDRMCEGFRHGHLYLQELPSAALLAKPNPLAPENVRLGLWDASLYKGHYYLYWGPVPALMLLALKELTGSHARISDQWPTVLFMCGRLWAGALLILSLASRVRLRQPAWICGLAIAVFGLANPLPFIVARPFVYEASLTGGQCFLFWGLFLAFWGLEKQHLRRYFFLLASVAWALAIGCRVTNFLTVPLVMLTTAGFAWYDSKRTMKALLYDCLALGVPVAAASCAYGAYNYARFDSVTEFGTNHQVTLQPFYGKAAFIIPNIFSYLFAPVNWSCRFPFVSIIGYRPLSTLIHWPSGYLVFEKVGGIMLTAGWCWLLLLCVWRLVANYSARVRASPPAASNLSTHELWALLCSGAIVLSMVPVLSLWEASMRYAGDAVGGIALAATLGVFWLLNRSYLARRSALGFFARGLVLALGIQTCIVGAFAAFTSSDDPIKNKNPELYAALDERLSLCGNPH